MVSFPASLSMLLTQAPAGVTTGTASSRDSCGTYYDEFEVERQNIQYVLQNYVTLQS